MKQELVQIHGELDIEVGNVGGDLQVIGWDRSEVLARTDDTVAGIQSDGQVFRISSDGDLALYIGKWMNVRVQKVGGDADLRLISGKVDLENIGGDLQMRDIAGVNVQMVGGDADLRLVSGSVGIQTVGGDLQMRDIAGVEVNSVGGDLSLKGCAGDFGAVAVGGDASLHNVRGNVQIVVGADLYLHGCDWDVEASVGADAALYLCPPEGRHVQVSVGGDVMLRLPRNANVLLELSGGDEESIRVDLPGVVTEPGAQCLLQVGTGGGKVTLSAGSDVVVTSRSDEWENMAEFDPLGKEDPLGAGAFAGLDADLHERISRQVDEAVRKAADATARINQGLQESKIQQRVEDALRRAEEKMRSVERRTAQTGVRVGKRGWGAEDVRPPVPPVPPVPPRPVSEPVTDDERLVVLKMLQDKKISLQEAEKLLAALDGR